MEIYDILVNQIKEPLGFALDQPRITFKLKDASPQLPTFKSIKVWLDDPKQPVFQSNNEVYEDNSFEILNKLQPRQRYHFEIQVINGKQAASASSWFETGKMDEPLLGSWIANPDKKLANTLFKKKFTLAEKKVKSARLYATALGLYEAYLDNEKISAELLAPGFTAYDQWVQLQTYDVTEFLQNNNEHELKFSVGDGWYKGRIGFNNQPNTYGDQQMVIAELHIQYKDGSEEVIATDSTWQTAAGKITASGIYYGEDIDDTIEPTDWQNAEVLNKEKTIIGDRLSLPLKIKEELAVQKIIKTPKGETVLDFGQNHAGWPLLYNRLLKGKKISLHMGEVLQDGNFYNDNLRQARAAFTYCSDGQEKWVRPHFTYFGFRYVKVDGDLTNIDPQDFKSAVIYSDMAASGTIKTNNALVNCLFENVKWGEKSNFFDVPTDCPQRDERLGWTGDAEIFSETATFNMNTFAFFKKYAKDMLLEQKQHQGMLTAVVPSIKMDTGGMAIWSDAATIIPWMMYRFYGDCSILKQNFSQMRAWVDWITKHTKKPGLWIGTQQLGDWLALDNFDPHNPQGKTDSDFIASIYYAYSASIVSQTAAVLNLDLEAKKYRQLSQTIIENILKEYITSNGRVAIDTQTAYVLTMFFDLVSEQQKEHVMYDLVQRIHQDNDHLTTGFVGTPYLCPILSENGQHELATTIFLQKDFPSWLYEVEHGATTIWERWNSVLPDGKMNPEGMNSLNHYSFGAVMAWAYKYVLGIRQHSAGFKQIEFAPEFDLRLSDVSGYYDMPYGKLQVEYHLQAGYGQPIVLKLQVPFGVEVQVRLPDAAGKKINVNGQEKDGLFALGGGDYQISYCPNHDLQKHLDLDIEVGKLMKRSELVAKIDQLDPTILRVMKKRGNRSRMMAGQPLSSLLKTEKVDYDVRNKIEELLFKTPKYEN